MLSCARRLVAILMLHSFLYPPVSSFTNISSLFHCFSVFSNFFPFTSSKISIGLLSASLSCNFPISYPSGNSFNPFAGSRKCSLRSIVTAVFVALFGVAFIIFFGLVISNHSMAFCLAEIVSNAFFVFSYASSWLQVISILSMILLAWSNWFGFLPLSTK